MDLKNEFEIIINENLEMDFESWIIFYSIMLY